LQQMNKRILVATHDPEPSWQQDSNLFVLDYAPHTWLFPRMAAVIHHGGAGTTAAGLHAGVPSLIMPFSNDQPMWAKRVCELSTGTSFRPDHKPSEPKLHHAITQLFDTTIVHKAQEIGKRMQAEQGVDNAVAWLRAQSLV
ncbi:MAG: nucleotide disphospho-sugar-binding domain-containing protein, partial [Myxococcota bacterium]